MDVVVPVTPGTFISVPSSAENTFVVVRRKQQKQERSDAKSVIYKSMLVSFPICKKIPANVAIEVFKVQRKIRY